MTWATERRCRSWLTVAAVATAVVMAASMLRDARVTRQAPRVYVGVAIARGAVFTSYARDSTGAMAKTPHWRLDSSAVWGTPRLVLTPKWQSGAVPVAGPSWNLTLPLWPVALGLSGVAGWLWRRRLSRPEHLCRECRYDLRGSVGPACPECGADRAGHKVASIQ
jgi:hypothetical protein